jgi:hypothetical protein
MWADQVVVLALVVIGVCYLVQVYVLVKIVWKKKKPHWTPPPEIVFDPTITTPSQNLYLLQFTFDPMGGPRCCKKMWYSFRYVNTDGRYGALGTWTTIPVYAGAKTLPCIPPTPPKLECGLRCVLPGGRTGPCVPTGNDSCNSNRPVVGVVNELDYQVNKGQWYAVIHRQTDQFDPTSEGTPIGFLLGSQDPQNGGLYSWPDVVFSDNLGSGCVC